MAPFFESSMSLCLLVIDYFIEVFLSTYLISNDKVVIDCETLLILLVVIILDIELVALVEVDWIV